MDSDEQPGAHRCVCCQQASSQPHAGVSVVVEGLRVLWQQKAGAVTAQQDAEFAALCARLSSFVVQGSDSMPLVCAVCYHRLRLNFGLGDGQQPAVPAKPAQKVRSNKCACCNEKSSGQFIWLSSLVKNLASSWANRVAPTPQQQADYASLLQWLQNLLDAAEADEISPPLAVCRACSKYTRLHHKWVDPKDRRSTKNTEPMVTLGISDQAVDEWKWESRGQRTIAANPHPRIYYTCKVPGCPARKTMDQKADGGVMVRYYGGNHNHDPPGAPGAGAGGGGGGVLSLRKLSPDDPEVGSEGLSPRPSGPDSTSAPPGATDLSNKRRRSTHISDPAALPQATSLRCLGAARLALELGHGPRNLGRGDQHPGPGSTEDHDVPGMGLEEAYDSVFTDVNHLDGNHQALQFQAVDAEYDIPEEYVQPYQPVLNLETKNSGTGSDATPFHTHQPPPFAFEARGPKEDAEMGPATAAADGDAAEVGDDAPDEGGTGGYGLRVQTEAPDAGMGSATPTGSVGQPLPAGTSQLPSGGASQPLLLNGVLELGLPPTIKCTETATTTAAASLQAPRVLQTPSAMGAACMPVQSMPGAKTHQRSCGGMQVVQPQTGHAAVPGGAQQLALAPQPPPSHGGWHADVAVIPADTTTVMQAPAAPLAIAPAASAPHGYTWQLVPTSQPAAVAPSQAVVLQTQAAVGQQLAWQPQQWQPAGTPVAAQPVVLQPQQQQWQPTATVHWVQQSAQQQPWQAGAGVTPYAVQQAVLTQPNCSPAVRLTPAAATYPCHGVTASAASQSCSAGGGCQQPAPAATAHTAVSQSLPPAQSITSPQPPVVPAAGLPAAPAAGTAACQPITAVPTTAQQAPSWTAPQWQQMQPPGQQPAAPTVYWQPAAAPQQAVYTAGQQWQVVQGGSMPAATFTQQQPTWLVAGQPCHTPNTIQAVHGTHPTLAAVSPQAFTVPMGATPPPPQQWTQPAQMPAAAQSQVVWVSPAAGTSPCQWQTHP